MLFQCFSSLQPSDSCPPRLPLFSPTLIGFPLPHTIHFFSFFSPLPLFPVLCGAQCGLKHLSNLKLKPTIGRPLPGTSRSPHYTEDARVLSRIIGKSLRFSGNQTGRERETSEGSQTVTQAAGRCACRLNPCMLQSAASLNDSTKIMSLQGFKTKVKCSFI